MSAIRISLLGIALALIAGVAWSQDAATGDRQRGAGLWIDYQCYSCHGRSGQGGSFNGPHLQPDMDYEAFEAQLRNPAQRMPPYRSAILPERDLVDLFAYLSALRPSPAAPR